jgi:hypothetical protein
MHKIGENQGLSKMEQQQVLKEILQIIEGQVQVDVTRAGSSSMDREVLNTSSMFFVCFGVFEAEEQLLNQVPMTLNLSSSSPTRRKNKLECFSVANFTRTRRYLGLASLKKTCRGKHSSIFVRRVASVTKKRRF